jgi:hypothetical protein
MENLPGMRDSGEFYELPGCGGFVCLVAHSSVLHCYTLPVPGNKRPNEVTSRTRYASTSTLKTTDYHFESLDLGVA